MTDIKETGIIYELDGIRYRCEGGYWFQQLNEDGSDYKVFYQNSEGQDTNRVKDHGRRFITDRVGEMEKV